MSALSESPIGIFDSGVGGLTVAKAVVEQLPNEHIIYFGDTMHLPYGDKSTAAIQAYAIRIVQFLLEKKCKMIVIACNSASAAAYDLVTEYVAKKALVVNVIDPVVNHLREHYAGKRVGLIGTRQTVNSGEYQKKVQELGIDINISAYATPLLAPAIEDGFVNNRIIVDLLAEYLRHDSLQQIEALILGCTHYPLIKKEIEKYYHNRIDILDSAKIVAEVIKAELVLQDLTCKSAASRRQFYVSDYTDSFAQSAKLFFGADIHLEQVGL